MGQFISPYTFRRKSNIRTSAAFRPDQVHRRGGAIIGQEIYMAGNLNNAVGEWANRANQTWTQVARKISRNNAIKPEIKILWNSLIRGAMIYGLCAKDIPRKLLNKLDTYMYKHLRTMMNPRWEIYERLQEKKKLYRTLQQSTMKS